jgi:hypothetical protein
MNTPQESPSGGPNHAGNVVKTVASLYKRAAKGMRLLLTNAVDVEDAIHPDFRMPWKIDERLTWYGNKSWGPMPEPSRKIGFYFNDPTVLDGCPWVAKIAKNIDDTKPGYAYFCLLFGDPNKWKDDFGFDDMKEWASGFDEVRVMTYAGITTEIVRKDAK